VEGSGVIGGGQGAGLQNIADKTIMSNISGAAALPTGNTVTAIFDYDLSNVNYKIIQRIGGVWTTASQLTFGGAVTLNSSTLTFGTAVGAEDITLYDGGAGVRYGWGIQANELQSFLPAGSHWSWNSGGDIQVSGTNEVMRLTGAGLLGVGTVAPGSDGVTGTFIDVESTDDEGIIFSRNTASTSFGNGLILFRNTHNLSTDQNIAEIVCVTQGTTTNKGGQVQVRVKTLGVHNISNQPPTTFSFNNDYSISIYGSTSGTLSIKTPAIAGSNTLTFPAGTTDFSATGGASYVVKQNSAGAALTVAQLATTDLSDIGTFNLNTTGTGVLANLKLTSTTGVENAILDVDGVANFANAAKFGNLLPVYMIQDNPAIGFNTYYNGEYKFGKGSAANYAGLLAFTSAGGSGNTFFFYGSTATGNADAAATLLQIATIGTGGLGLSGSTSGVLTIKPPAVAGTNTLTLPAGTTDLSATGAVGARVMQQSAGAALTVSTPATTQSQPASPTAPASTAAYKMQGLAGAITPATSGKVLLMISGNFISSTVTAGDGIKIQLSYGTGTAPANAANLTGTQVAAPLEYTNPTTVIAADVFMPFSTQAVVTGLTLGTAYWIDLAAESVVTISSVGLANISLSAIEL